MNGGSLSLNWYAVYTKPRQEDLVVKNLWGADIQCFGPKLKRTKYLREKYREVIQPLFPCYVFAQFDFNQSYRLVKYTRGVKSIVGGRGVPWPVSEEIIRTIESRMDKDGAVVIKPAIKPGDIVEIADGPLSGLSGIFEGEMKDSERVIVLLNAIAYEARVEIQRDCLREGSFIK